VGDVWVLILLPREEIGAAARMLGYLFVILEMIVKVILTVIMIIWRVRNSKSGNAEAGEAKRDSNVL
jgi:hypothetical protein